MYVGDDNSGEKRNNKRRSSGKEDWKRRLKRLTRKESKGNMNNNDPDYAVATTTDYQEMQDPLQSISPPFRKQETGATQISGIGDEDEEEEIYLVAQSYGYCAILFSIAQTVILIIMMVQCGVAPLNVNPMVGPYPDALSEWGGKNAVNIIADGEWWRLVTPILLHAGVIHLLCNIAVQLETGAFFEREWGSTNWMIIYLSSAVGSSILSVIAMPNSVSVGSSGAVMGLFGGKLAEVICRACESTKTRQGRIAHSVRKEQLGGTLCAVILVMAFSFIPYVDWAAHLGGLVSGLFVGFAVFSCSIKTMVWRIIWFVFGMVLTIASFTYALVYMYSGVVEPAEELRDVCGYYQQFFEDYECKCMRNGGE